MKKITCLECHKGIMEAKVIPNYETKMRGKSVTIRNAAVTICNKCGWIAVSAKELKRWQEQVK